MSDMFEIYKKKISLTLPSGVKEFELLPLSGEYYIKLIGLMKKLSPGEGVTDAVFINNIDDESLRSIYDLVVATMKSSYSKLTPEQTANMELFCSQHLFELFLAIVDLNLNNGASTDPAKE